MTLKLPVLPELSPNHLAMPLVKKLLENYQILKVAVHVQNGVHIIDCGVHVPGGAEAGVLFASICMGGLGRVDVRWADFQGFRWPTVQVVTDHPLRACLLSQFAGWPIHTRDYSAMGSGPGRAVADTEEMFSVLECADLSDTAIICLECEDLPSTEAIRSIVGKCRCEPEKVFILVAPTASTVGSVQIAARALETGLYKLKQLSFDITTIQSGWGICPLPPVAPDSISALGRSNDAILYGATVYYNVYHDDDEYLAELTKKVPSCASPKHGQFFAKIFEQYKDFYEIDPLFFSPAEIWLTNLKSGRTYHAGAICPDIVQASFGMS